MSRGAHFVASWRRNFVVGPECTFSQRIGVTFLLSAVRGPFGCLDRLGYYVTPTKRPNSKRTTPTAKEEAA